MGARGIEEGAIPGMGVENVGVDTFESRYRAPNPRR